MANRVLKALRTRTASVLRPSPLVSVIIPVFNVGRYLDEAITSVRNQTHERLQIIVIDDGSTDDSRAVAERHAAQIGVSSSTPSPIAAWVPPETSG